MINKERIQDYAQDQRIDEMERKLQQTEKEKRRGKAILKAEKFVRELNESFKALSTEVYNVRGVPCRVESKVKRDYFTGQYELAVKFKRLKVPLTLTREKWTIRWKSWSHQWCFEEEKGFFQFLPSTHVDISSNNVLVETIERKLAKYEKTKNE